MEKNWKSTPDDHLGNKRVKARSVSGVWEVGGDEKVIGFGITNKNGDIYSAGRFPPAVHHHRYPDEPPGYTGL